VLAELADQLLDRLLAAEEKTRILLAERQQAAIGADGLTQGSAVGGSLAADAGEQQIELGGIGEVGT